MLELFYWSCFYVKITDDIYKKRSCFYDKVTSNILRYGLVSMTMLLVTRKIEEHYHSLHQVW